MFFVTRINTLGAVTGKEVLVEFQTGYFFQYRYAIFFGGAGVNGRFVNNDVAFFQHFTDGFGSFDQRSQIRFFVFVNRGRHGNDENVAGFQIVDVVGVAEVLGRSQLFVVYFQSGVVALFQGFNTGLMDVEADYRAFFAEFDCQRQANIA